MQYFIPKDPAHYVHSMGLDDQDTPQISYQHLCGEYGSSTNSGDSTLGTPYRYPNWNMTRSCRCGYISHNL